MNIDLAKAYELTLDLAYKAGGLGASDAIDLVKAHARELFKANSDAANDEMSDDGA